MGESSSKPGIIVVGSPRSGTTLLRRLLDAHPGIACPPETYVFSAAARFLHHDRFAAGLRIGVVDGLAFAGFEEDEVLARLRGMCFGFLDDYAARQGKARWAEKTAFHSFHLPAIRRLCTGHVKFVCLHRHGLDVAVSLRDLVDKTGGYVSELHDYLRRWPEPLEALTRAWVDVETEIAELAEGEDAISLRYEDLVEDPEAEVRRLLEFLDEPWDAELLPRALGEAGTMGFGDWKTYARKAIDRSSVGRWQGLPEPVLAKLAGICNPTLTRLGYEAVEADLEGPDPESARRRYQMGLLLNRSRSE
ncbi:sulfotransferase [Pseudenhygromyxa sp. WMMC2535]|uniref:sulfotransferase family protein n=1 Tax=Pseudenhygromyxa sp. WMMC2535 TaxID=2712867 RepID=UPI0015580620|nr:sulfotransferase [Pseudenhygromyxa sp. WMMC2535]NVB39421.1 sulfotransferase [Pseudenhygromyxa sp. WMMC2535]